MSARDACTCIEFIGCGGAQARAVAGPHAIGFKAHNLARMAARGLPVPAGFVLGTGWCARPDTLPEATWRAGVRALEGATALVFGDARRPLLVSVRSGAPVSMPGMLDTLLDVGLSDRTVDGLIRLTGNPRLAWDAYRRLVAGYGQTVLGLPSEPFDADLEAAGAGDAERELDFDQLRTLTRLHQATVRRLAGRDFPQDPWTQLREAIAAVYASWASDKAVAYRRLKAIADDMGTAVTVQRMVFGNAGGLSGAGVGFTRHPSTGEPEPWIDFLFNAQGEDVVSGRRTATGAEALQAVAPAVWHELRDAVALLEATFGDMQDFEFTVQEGALFMLQTRDGKRTPQAAARIALDLHDEGRISRDEALRRTEGLDARTLAVTALEAGSQPDAWLARAPSACSGVVTGCIALDLDAVRACARAAQPAILVRPEAETSDFSALQECAGLLTMRGSRTSHAAVVARQLGKVCLVGCPTLSIDLARRRITVGDRELAEGETLTLDGNEGGILAGTVRTVQAVSEPLLRRLQALREPPVETTLFPAQDTGAD
jgi:pyruvate,orthophosphate dikinase